MLMKYYFLAILLHLSYEIKYLFVYEHCRHGARSPPFSSSSSYTDEYGTKWFGDGELTTIGQRMHHIIGIRSRIKYSSLLSPSFNSKEIIITSTNSNRTMTSVMAQLYAMYPMGSGDVLSEEEVKLAYPPNKISDEVKSEVEKLGNDVIYGKMPLIPIHNFDMTKKYIFLNEASECPSMKEYQEELKNKSSLNMFLNKLNSTFGDELQKYFHKDNRDFIFDFNSIISITDNFISNIDNGKDISSFTSLIDKDSFYQMAIELKTIFLYEMKIDAKTSKLASTPYMRDLLIWMQNRIDLDKEDKSDHVNYTMPKMVIHSGHDTSLAPIEMFMSVVFDTKYKYVSFASNVFFELYKDDNSNYKVSYLIDDELMLTMSFDDFKTKIEENIMTDDEIENFCYLKVDDEKDKTIKTFIIMTITFASTTLLFLILTIVFYLRNRKHSKKQCVKSSLIPPEIYN